MADQTKNLANWTIMIYIAADDVLANFAVVSLKQLKRAASPDVVVAAQFDADGRRNIPRFIFDGSGDKDGSLEENKKDSIPLDLDMADPTVLRAFIDWAYLQCPAKHYGLVLWGHGPELLFDDYPTLGSKKAPKKFMTPSDLGKALADTKLVRGTPDKPGKFDVIGIDACSMSMVELACEIKDYADFLVASQEEVPDFSFPYDSLLQAFGKTDQTKEIVDMCKDIPRRYADAYGDYILTKDTRMESLTLSSLSLGSVQSVIGPLTSLAEELLKSSHDPQKRQAITTARANSKGFVAGLYTDLCDFCEELRSELCSANLCDDALVNSCKTLCDAICRSDDAPFVIANETTQDKHCHGLSIYFPYLTDAEQSALQAPLAPLVKGGIDVLNKGGIDVLNKGGIDVLNKGGIDVLNKVRRQRIQETEQYYAGLKLSAQTGWGDFIKYGWSRCLAEYAEAKAKMFPEQDVSDILDDRYSAQQCAVNLLSLYRKPNANKNLPKPSDAGSEQKHSTSDPSVLPSGQDRSTPGGEPVVVGATSDARNGHNP